MTLMKKWLSRNFRHLCFGAVEGRLEIFWRVWHKSHEKCFQSWRRSTYSSEMFFTWRVWFKKMTCTKLRIMNNWKNTQWRIFSGRKFWTPLSYFKFILKSQLKNVTKLRTRALILGSTNISKWFNCFSRWSYSKTKICQL